MLILGVIFNVVRTSFLIPISQNSRMGGRQGSTVGDPRELVRAELAMRRDRDVLMRTSLIKDGYKGKDFVVNLENIIQVKA